MELQLITFFCPVVSILKSKSTTTAPLAHPHQKYWFKNHYIQFHGLCLYLWQTTEVRLSRKQMAKGPRYDHMRWSAVICHVPVWLDDGGAHKRSVSDTLYGFGCSMLWQGQLGSCILSWHYSCGLLAWALMHNAMLVVPTPTATFRTSLQKGCRKWEQNSRFPVTHL